MGLLTLDEFIENIKLNFGDNTAWATPTDFYTRWFNRAYVRLTTQDKFWGIRRSFYFPQLETSTTADTADGTAYISTPTDALIVRNLYDTTNNYFLNNISPRKYAEYTDRANTDMEGKPTEWVRQGGYLYLHSTPDDAYTIGIYYRMIPAVLETGAETTAIGAEWDEPLIALACAIGKQDTMDYEAAKIYREEFKDQVQGILTIYGQEEASRDERIHVHEAYRDRSY